MNTKPPPPPPPLCTKKNRPEKWQNVPKNPPVLKVPETPPKWVPHPPPKGVYGTFRDLVHFWVFLVQSTFFFGTVQFLGFFLYNEGVGYNLGVFMYTSGGFNYIFIGFLWYIFWEFLVSSGSEWGVGAQGECFVRQVHPEKPPPPTHTHWYAQVCF